MTPLFAGGPVRMFRLSNVPGERGLSCTPDGVALAGVPLVRKTPAGFVPRTAADIASLLKSAYGDQPMALQSRLSAITQALNRGDFATAMIAAVHTRTPELTAEAAARLVQADQELAKYNYNPEEPRDERGRWTRDGSAASAVVTTPPIETNERAVAADNRPWRVTENTFPPGDSVLSDTISLSGGNSTATATDSDDPPKPTARQEAFERKYDDLGPEEFSKKVIEFAHWLEAHGRDLSPAEKEQAVAEYDFLQSRLSTWINYEYKSARESNYLLSAATWLFQGGANSGLVPIGHLPASMLSVAGTVALFDTPPPSRLLPKPKAGAAEPPPALRQPPGNDRFVPIVEREIAGITWGKGIRRQGLGDGDAGWEKYIASQNPDATLLPPGSKVFDVFKETSGEAISAKTLDTKTMTCIRNPQEVFNRVRRYVNDVLNYEPRRESDLDPADIQSKTIQLAIPEDTSQEQWRYLRRAIIYGKDNGVRIVITGIRG
jgi:hypothetical protein